MPPLAAGGPPGPARRRPRGAGQLSVPRLRPGTPAEARLDSGELHLLLRDVGRDCEPGPGSGGGAVVVAGRGPVVAVERSLGGASVSLAVPAGAGALGGLLALVAAVQQVERGTLALRRTVGAYVPGYALAPDERALTVRELIDRPAGRRELLRHVVEAGAGRPVDRLVRDGIARPLGVGAAGERGLQFNAPELAVLARTLLSGGSYGTARILGPAYAELVLRAPGLGGAGGAADASGDGPPEEAWRGRGVTGLVDRAAGVGLVVDPGADAFLVLLATGGTRARDPWSGAVRRWVRAARGGSDR